MKRLIPLLFPVVLLSASAPALGDIYRWVDPSGVVHFSSQADDPSAKRLTEEDLAPVTETGNVTAADTKGETAPGPGTITVSGSLLFDGGPLPLVSTAPAMISVYRFDIKQWYTPDFSYDPQAGTFLIRGLVEGTYMGQALVDADPSNPGQYPGDYKATFRFDAEKSKPAAVIADMERIIHLTSPADNGAALKEWGSAVCQNRIEFETPVVIAWEPVAQDASYKYQIIRTECKPFAFRDTVAVDEIRATRVALALKPNKEGEFYTLRIEARKSNRPVGTLMTHGTNGWGWDYRFRVLPGRGPTRVISPAE